MSGERDLSRLLAGMQPELNSGTYVFCTLAGGQCSEYAHLEPLASYREAEGLSLVVRREKADQAGLSYDGLFRCITLTVHSSLEAVGLTAAVAGALAEQGISANVIAAYYHDHFFVPSERAEEAMDVLRKMSISDV